MLGLLYIVLALGGCGFIVFSAVTGAGDGVDDALADSGGAYEFSLLSPLTLAILFASVGAYGLIARHGFGVGDMASVPISVLAGFVTAYVIGRIAFRLLASARGSSSIPADAFVGATADVVTAIPAGGVGEVVVADRNSKGLLSHNASLSDVRPTRHGVPERP